MKITNHGKLFGGLTLLLVLGLLSSCTRGLSVIPTVISTPTFTRTLTPTSTFTFTNTATSASTSTFTATSTPTNSPTFTLTPIFSFTFTNTLTITNTPTITLTPTNTFTPTLTSTPTITSTPTATATTPPVLCVKFENWDGPYCCGNAWGGVVPAAAPGYMDEYYGGVPGSWVLRNLGSGAQAYTSAVEFDSTPNSLQFPVSYIGASATAYWGIRSNFGTDGLGSPGYGSPVPIGASCHTATSKLNLMVKIVSGTPMTLNVNIGIADNTLLKSWYTGSNGSGSGIKQDIPVSSGAWTTVSVTFDPTLWDTSFGTIDWANLDHIWMQVTGPVAVPANVDVFVDTIGFYN